MHTFTIARVKTSVNGTWKRLLAVTGLLLLVALVGYVPIALDNLYLRDVFAYIALYVMLGMGMTIVLGYAGLLDLGYIAFYGIGAYTLAWFTAQANLLPFWAALPIAIALGTVSGVILGFPTLRLRPDYLAMVTLGFGEIVRLALVNLDPITQGPRGIVGIPLPDFGLFTIQNGAQLYWLIIVVASFLTYVTYRLGDSRIGRGWTYTREDEIAAEATGIDTVRLKLLAFAIGAAFAGLAGAFFAVKMTMVAPESFTWWESLNVLIIVVMGGMGSLPGVVLGAALMVGLPELLRDFADYRMLILGVLLVLLALFRPQGLWPSRSRAASSKLAPAARPARGEGASFAAGLGAVRSDPGPAAEGKGTTATSHGPLLEATGICKQFGGVAALTNVDLRIYPGEIVSLIGPNGAGKTTFLNVVTSVYPATQGSVSFAGQPLAGLRPNRIAALGVGRTFQHIRLFSELTVLENVAAGLHCRTRSGPLAAVLRTPAQRAEEQAIWERSLAILGDVGLVDRADDLAKNLPYGEQRCLEVARALATAPRLLILDEPAAGLSAHETDSLMALARSLRQQGLSVLLIEHDMDVVMSISDRVIVLDYGEIIAQGTPAEVQNDPKVIEAYLGRDDED